MKGKGGEQDFRAFPQFQICHYTTDHKLNHSEPTGKVCSLQLTPTYSQSLIKDKIT